MNKLTAIRALFVLAGLYDGLLGLLFFFAGETLFEHYGVTPPNHWGYVQFPALLLVVFALMFFQVARDPRKNRNLIPYGVLLKASYCGVVFFYWAQGNLPGMWRPFAVIDLVFGLLFIWAYIAVGRREREAGSR